MLNREIPKVLISKSFTSDTGLSSMLDFFSFHLTQTALRPSRSSIEKGDRLLWWPVCMTGLRMSFGNSAALPLTLGWWEWSCGQAEADRVHMWNHSVTAGCSVTGEKGEREKREKEQGFWWNKREKRGCHSGNSIQQASNYLPTGAWTPSLCAAQSWS